MGVRESRIDEQHISEAGSTFIEQKTTELAGMKEYSEDLTRQVRERLINNAGSTFFGRP
jgi:hypothetical protein